MGKFTMRIKEIVSMSDHLDIQAASLTIKKNIHFRGPTVFILVCAIVIASIGLNVNSIPVIIGAMLISPLMGPIVGFGLGLGTNDTELLKDALRNFIVMVGISIVASTLYFILTPLTLEHPTELLARTNPTIYDVLIAFTGGIAGMIETSRKERGTVLSGVAIATALMPPLCTVGYGLANLEAKYFFGAAYLFFINCVFIALATFLTAKYLGFPVLRYEDKKMDRRRTYSIIILILVVIIPSVFSAVKVVKESNFTRYAAQIYAENRAMGRSYIYDYRTNLSTSPATIELFMAGESPDDLQRERIYSSAEKRGITRSQIIIREDATSQAAGISDQEIVRSIYEQNEKRIQSREEVIAGLREELDAYKAKEMPVEMIAKELNAQFGNVTGIVLTRGHRAEAVTVQAPADTSAANAGTDSAKPAAPKEEIVAIVNSTSAINNSSIEKIENWLKVRLNVESVTVINKVTKERGSK